MFKASEESTTRGAKQVNQALKFLVCGLEHSGTTMVSDLFREQPETESGFECGVLLCESPREFLTFEPFCNHMEVGWGINKDDLVYACETDEFVHFYQRLFERSSIVKTKQPNYIFDKTPRYITHLQDVQSRLLLPTIAVLKDPRSLAVSDFKRTKRPMSEIEDWYKGWKIPKMNYMRSAYHGYQHAWSDSRCLVVRLEDICFDAKKTVKSMYDFVGIEFKTEYLNLRHKRFGNTSGYSISVGSCMDFMDILPKKIQEMIVTDFAEFTDWFYSF